MPAYPHENKALLESENPVVDTICRKIIEDHLSQATSTALGRFFRSGDKMLATPAGLAVPIDLRQATNLSIDALSEAFVARNFASLEQTIPDLESILTDASAAQGPVLRSYMARSLGLNELTSKLQLFRIQNPGSAQADAIHELFKGLKKFSTEIAEIVAEDDRPMTVAHAQTKCSKALHALYTGTYTVAAVLASASGGLGGLALLKNLDVFDRIPTFDDEWYYYVPNLMLGLIGLTVWFVLFIIFRKVIFQMKWFGLTRKETIQNFVLNVLVGVPLGIYSSLPSVRFTAVNFKALCRNVHLDASSFLTTMAQGGSLAVNTALGLNVVRDLAAIGSAMTSFFRGLQVNKNLGTVLVCGLAVLGIIGANFAILLPYLSYESQLPEGWVPESWQSLSSDENLAVSVTAGVINGFVGLGPLLRGERTPFTIFQPRFSLPENISGIVVGCMSVLIFSFFIKDAVRILFASFFLSNPILAEVFLYALEILAGYLNFSVYSILPARAVASFSSKPDYRLPALPGPATSLRAAKPAGDSGILVANSGNLDSDSDSEA